jgi:hypothetical protein
MPTLQVLIVLRCINWLFVVVQMYSAFSEAGTQSLSIICFWRCRKEKLPLIGGTEETSVRAVLWLVSIRIQAQTVCSPSPVGSSLLQCHTVSFGFKETFFLHSEGSSWRRRILLENEGRTFLRNIGDHSPIYAALHPSRLESSVTPLWTPRNTVTCSKNESIIFSAFAAMWLFLGHVFTVHLDINVTLCLPCILTLIFSFLTDECTFLFFNE